MHSPTFNLRVVDEVELAGTNQLLAPFVARRLRQHLEDELAQLAEPGILVIDLLNTSDTAIDSSILQMSIIDVLEISQQMYSYKTVVCSNATRGHRRLLEKSIRERGRVQSEFRIGKRQNRLLLLVSERENPKAWHLLGKEVLTGSEGDLWELIADADDISIAEIAATLAIQERTVRSGLQVLLDNGVVTSQGTRKRQTVCGVSRWLSANMESTR